MSPPANFDRFFPDFVDRIVYLFKKIRCDACSHFATFEDLFGRGSLVGIYFVNLPSKRLHTDMYIQLRHAYLQELCV